MLKNKSQIIFILLLLAIVLIVGWFTYNNYLKTDGVSKESVAFEALGTNAATAYTDVSGNPVDLSEYLGRIVVVSSWASWSPFSAADLKTLSEVAANYSTDEVVVLAINRAEPKETAVAYLRANDVNSDIQLVLDRDDVFYQSIEGYSMPETVVFDRAGDIISHQRGALSRAVLVDVLDTAVSTGSD